MGYIDEILGVGGAGPLTGVNSARNNPRKNPWTKFNFTPPEQEEDPTAGMEGDWQSFLDRSKAKRNTQPPDFDSPAMSRYLEHVSQTPNRGDYSPSIWHRIVAGLAGGAAGGQGNPIAGVKAAEDVLDMPYRRALEDYQVKGQGLEAASKLEQTGYKQQLDYHKQIAAEDKADKDRAVKWIDSQTRRLNAQIAERRLDLDDKIKGAKNELDREKFTQEKMEFERSAANQLRELVNQERQLDISQQNANTNSDRAGAYRGYLDTLKTGRPLLPNQIGAMRSMISETVQNQHPEWYNKRTGAVDPQFSNLVEEEIQRKMRTAIPGYGNINLPNGPVGMGIDYGSIPDMSDNPYERIP